MSVHKGKKKCSNFDDFPSTTREWKCKFFSHTLRIFERSKVINASGRAVDFGSFYAPLTINTIFDQLNTRHKSIQNLCPVKYLFGIFWGLGNNVSNHELFSPWFVFLNNGRQQSLSDQVTQTTALSSTLCCPSLVLRVESTF